MEDAQYAAVGERTERRTGGGTLAPERDGTGTGSHQAGRGGTAGLGALPLLRLVGRAAQRPLLPAARLWRRNIQLRVVATTLLMSLGVVLVLGLVVIGQVRNGLLEAKTRAAQGQALGGFNVAQGLAAGESDPRGQGDTGTTGPSGTATGRGQTDPGTWLTTLVQQLASGGQGVYYVVALSSDADQQLYRGDSSPSTRGPRASGDVLPEESVPAALRNTVATQSGAHQRDTRIIREGDPEGQPGLVIGKRLNDIGGKAYELYYLFPFTQEEKTLNLVETTLATAGVFVVVLLGAIAWLVVRQVVTPVRMAAGISERLADGLLQERMKVSGEDDIARLGESFNKMAQTLQTKIQQLEELSRMQRRFVSDVSHELRTPLTTVRMAADVIHDARGDFDPVTARSAELLQSQIERFESLLADLLEISRFDAGAAALDAEPIDLREVVHRVVDAAEPLAERKGSRIVVRGGEQPVIAEADARRVERVLRNLVVNAVEHGEGRDVVVRLASAAGAVAVAVRDYGVGLKPGEATRVFNRFWRADPARARTTGGTGLGLSIALEDARLHGGWLQAWGEPGGGSQFRLTLPRTAGESLRGSPIPLEPEDSRRRRAARSTARSTSGVNGTTPGAARAGAPGTEGAPEQAPGTATARAARSALPDLPVPPGRTPPPPVSAGPAALPGSGSRVVAPRSPEPAVASAAVATRAADGEDTYPAPGARPAHNPRSAPTGDGDQQERKQEQERDR
ncbi:two-component system histidine kinase [Streptantibioticus cattleyicolor NRRL 8057 = DSM 46488]|uniref:Sensor histidine kinase MtrB n=1 Tax=Streptantibioticus cattleyicolor (strain ATCC 35852 / DSM 46488 / JCM 4925 / NBRC 14057 / NRRL 8057) TaxID=1003195 RepID=G8WWH0_STREN|nr:two-component system histidine kinase [Streptantibioticus cattleyicolor NRRL 8057 = DSM 46488]MYS59027.1 HAMP domain-containing protein [Streptomyces sp. SID5468]